MPLYASKQIFRICRKINTLYIFGYKMGFPFPRMTTNNKISPMKFSYYTSFALSKQSQDQDLSCNTDLDFWDHFGKKNSVL